MLIAADQDIHREFGDCLEDEFPCGLGEEDNDHFVSSKNKTILKIFLVNMPVKSGIK